jgi:hypothetical protein
MANPVFIGVVTEDGKLLLDFRRQFDAYLKRFAGDEVEVEVRKRRSKRSTQQNAYWWGVVIPHIASHCGYTPDETHEALKVKFLGQEDLSRGLVRVGSTAKLNTTEFADLVDRVVLWAAEDLGVIIPLPEERRVA